MDSYTRASYSYYYRIYFSKYVSRVGPNREKKTFGGRARRKTHRYFVLNVLRHIACFNEFNNIIILLSYTSCTIFVLNPNRRL